MSWPARCGVGPVLAVAGDRAVDDPRVGLAQALVADAEPVEHARAEALEHDVVRRATRRRKASRPASDLRSMPDRALAAVERQVERRARAELLVLVVAVVGRRPAHVVAAARVLDLEHLGAEVGEQQRAEAARQQPRQVEDADVARASRATRSLRLARAALRQRRASRAPRRRSRRGGPCPRPSGAPWRSGRRSSAPSRRRGGRSCPRARRGRCRPAPAPRRSASTGRARSRSPASCSAPPARRGSGPT